MAIKSPRGFSESARMLHRRLLERNPMETIGGILAATAFLSAFLESAIEYIFGGIPTLKPAMMGISLVCGILLAMVFNLDLIAPILETAKLSLSGFGAVAASGMGHLMTGFIISRGANFTHQFANTYLVPKDQQ